MHVLQNPLPLFLFLVAIGSVLLLVGVKRPESYQVIRFILKFITLLFLFLIGIFGLWGMLQTQNNLFFDPQETAPLLMTLLATFSAFSVFTLVLERSYSKKP